MCILPPLSGHIIALLMEAVITCETSVKFYKTARRDILEDRHLHSRRRENLKTHRNDFINLSRRKASGHTSDRQTDWLMV
jgi:hypothetical protein